jgi:peptide-methionine (S)-S-oxide reductase
MQTNSAPSRQCRLPVIRAGLGLLLTTLGINALDRLVNAAVAEPATPINPPLTDVQNSSGSKTEKAVFAGGCFWGVQAVFQHTKGVTSPVSGYAGGAMPGPSYEQVSSGRTGHAESVEITDPTQLNRQGPDEGTQYRSEIFATNDVQQHEAKAYIAELDKAHAFARRIVTKVEPLQAFYRAEPYHQDYATLHPSSPYIAVYDLPKIANLKKLYSEFYREQAGLVGDNRQ